MPKNTMLKLVKSADPLLVWRPQNRHVGGIVNLQKRILSLAKSSKQMVLVVLSVLIAEDVLAYLDHVVSELAGHRDVQ